MQQLQELIPKLWIYQAQSRDIEVRTVVVLGEKQAAVWDTLTHPFDLAGLAPLIADKPFHVIYSHADWDHIWGTGGFANRPLDIVAHDECLRRFGDDVPKTLQRMQLEQPGKWDGIRLLPPNLTFSSFLALDLGGLTLELHHLPGHTIDCIIGWIPQWGVLLGGDAIETPLPVVNNSQLLSGWLAALETWAAKEEVKHAIPSHGSLKGRESLDRTLAYLRALTSDRKFDLPRKLDDFYRETHQKNLIVADGGLAPDD